MYYVCVVELHVTQLYKNTECGTTMPLWQIYIAGIASNNRTYEGLHNNNNNIYLLQLGFHLVAVVFNTYTRT